MTRKGGSPDGTGARAGRTVRVCIAALYKSVGRHRPVRITSPIDETSSEHPFRVPDPVGKCENYLGWMTGMSFESGETISLSTRFPVT